MALSGRARLQPVPGDIDDARDDARIAAAFAGRHPDGLSEAYRKYGKLLYSIARNVLGNDEDAADCVHDALVRIWQNGFAYSTERGTLRSYLAVCVRNEAITRLRSDVRHRTIEQRTFRDAPQEYQVEIGDHLETARLKTAIASLPEEQRRAIELAYFGNLSQTQIAAKLDIPLGTVKGRISLAMHKLKSALSPAT